MKNKSFVLCAGLCAALALTGCKPSESAYKKAYEKAKAQEGAQTTAQNQAEVPTVTPLTPAAPVTQTTVQDNVDNATYRTEDVTVVNGEGLQAFSVVVGSFGLKANAEGLQQTLKAAGHHAQIAYNSVNRMYRVVASTHTDKASAVASRNQLRAQYPDAWLLYKK